MTGKPAFELSGYEIKERIHLGSRTRVFRARRLRDGMQVIIKTPASQVPGNSELRRLRREFSLGCVMKHAHVVRYESLENAGDSMALVMEDYGGESLKRLMPKYGYTLTSFLNLALQIAKGLSAVHEGRIVHKDIKTSNILLNSATGNVKITDFGISTELSEEYRTATGVSGLEGTLAYISPEQTGRMNRPIDYRTDFYSLGVTYYELLTGRLPFQADDPLELVHCHIARSPTPIRDIKPEIPEQMAGIIGRLLEKDAEERYQSANGLIADLTRCLTELNQNGHISRFPLGEHDFSDQFQVPHKLYGRERETRQLTEAFERSLQGEREMLCVTGYAGIGKSALVHEVLKPVTGHQGFFITGKFDQLNRNIPYSAFGPAFRGLVRQLLGESDAVIRSWREKLYKALGPNAGVLSGVIPDLALIMGENIHTEESEAVDPRIRFRLVFRDFVAAFATSEHPLVLFLDDLQWADAASLELLELILSDRSIGYFLLIGSYRDNEVNPGHPLIMALEGLEKKGILLEELHLEPLEIADLEQLVADTLRCPRATARPLTRMVFEKTHGNPFFSFELLKDLHRRGLLKLDTDRGQWIWNADEVRRVDVSENVVSFLVNRIRQLPKGTQDALKHAACIGDSFDLRALSHILGKALARVAADLWPALHEGILIPLDDAYRLLEPTPDSLDLKLEGLDVSYRFHHDRVQQAAYALIDSDHRRQVHLKIGRTMLESWDRNSPKQSVIDLVYHLNEGRDLLQDKEERLNLARLNLRAGNKAVASVAYKTALTYFQISESLLPENAWPEHYPLVYELKRSYAECAYLSGRIELAESLCRELLKHGKTELEKVDIYEMQMVQYTTVNKWNEAVNAGLKGLTLLGFNLPENPGTLSLLREVAIIKWWTRSGNIERLADRPLITDSRIRAVLNLLMRLALPTYFGQRTKLYGLSVLKRVTLSLRHGNSPETSHAFMTYGVLLIAFREKYREAAKYGDLALELNERFQYPSLRSKVFFIYGFLIHSWTHHRNSMQNWLEKAVEAGVQSGDLLYSSLAAVQLSIWLPQPDLETGLKMGERTLSLLADSPYLYLSEQATVAQQFRLALMGRTYDLLSFDDDQFQETSWVEEVTANQGSTSLETYHQFKARLAFIYDDGETAEKHIHQAEALLSSVMGTPLIGEFHFYRFLISARQFGIMPQAGKRRALKHMKKDLKKVRRWAELCRDNHLHRQYLMEAEAARLKGETIEAATLYQKAINEANRNAYRDEEALATLVAYRFYTAVNQDRVASVFLSDAVRLYARYGAVGAAGWLRELEGGLSMVTSFDSFISTWSTHTTSKETTLPESTHETSRSTTGTGGSSQDQVLDLATVVKSSLAISSEMDYEQLLAKIMDIILECAGAQRGILILQERGDMVIRAIAGTDGGRPDLEARPMDKYNNLPRKLVRYTFRKGRTLVTHNAAEDATFGNDRYIREAGVKSILCTPIRHKDRMAGVLYLENNLVDHVFTEDRVELLHLLFSQAAISLENARLLAESRTTEAEVRKLNDELAVLNAQLEERVRDRTAELKRARDELVEQAHQAGMADIATSVLHNVGNILNSVITSCQLIQDTVNSSKMDGLYRANALLRMNMDRLDRFILEDPKGRDLMTYYLRFDEHWTREKNLLNDNVLRLAEKIDSIREVIREQQTHAAKGFQSEELYLQEVVEEAVNVLGTSLTRQNIRIKQKYGNLPTLFLPKNKLLHLMINLFKNAKEAMAACLPNKRIIRIEADSDGDTVTLRVSDSGEGIPREHLEQIFTFGFTTKEDGHGFGLHTCANSMTEMGGAILVESEGVGKGATFIMTFPVKQEEAAAVNQEN
ncbi:MAG: AAA family ATPase [Acidobacteriota bacterium]|nr:AAA family ATPase [Acidobacteriota bacterium]